MARGIGYLQVFVTAAREAYPIAGAVVEVASRGTDGVRHPQAMRYTGISGEVETLALDAPAAEDSQTPSRGAHPFAEYDVSVHKEGYYPVTVRGVSVFAAVTSIQPFSLIPITPDAPYTDVPIVVDLTDAPGPDAENRNGV